MIEAKYKEIKVKELKFKVYEDSDNYDWVKLNSNINELKKKGIILYGNYLDTSKIDFNIDFSFFYSMNQKLCKKMLIEKKMIEWGETDDQTQIYFENVFNPLYDELKKNLSINKFFNIKEDTTFDNSYDELFKLLMELIEKKLKFK